MTFVVAILLCEKKLVLQGDHKHGKKSHNQLETNKLVTENHNVPLDSAKTANKHPSLPKA